MSEFESPHIRFPFTFTDDGEVLEVEEGSDLEVQQCAWAVLSYEPGQLIADPEFGTPSQVFKKNGVDIDQVRGIVERNDDRANEILERDPFWFETLVDTITIRRDTNNG